MERDPLRPGFPVYKERNGFILTSSLLHQATEFARRVDRSILDLLDDITQYDALGICLQLVINRDDHYSVHLSDGIAFAHRVGNRPEQHTEIQ